MLYAVTQDICNLLDTKKVYYTLGTARDMDAIIMTVKGNNDMSIRLACMIAHDGKDVALRVNRFAVFEEERRGRALELINQCHTEYRFVRFVLTEKGEVAVQMDLPQKTENVPEVVFECFARMTQILDNVYPMFMKAVWG